ncbi:hypothetical protein B0H10DRAFT_1949840 [Mycena sp. CBHHK59/15]|nr:hypothetical protein B0H10DRAFT_1949840 [Mycena sp. CBHHK59/15]
MSSSGEEQLAVNLLVEKVHTVRHAKGLHDPNAENTLDGKGKDGDTCDAAWKTCHRQQGHVTQRGRGNGHRQPECDTVQKANEAEGRNARGWSSREGWSAVVNWRTGRILPSGRFGWVKTAVLLGKDYCFQVYWPDSDVESDAAESWDTVCPTSLINLGRYDARVRRLFNMSRTAQRMKYVVRDRVEEWVDHSGRMLLIGEAAHPLLPCSTHGASLTVEDAEALDPTADRGLPGPAPEALRLHPLRRAEQRVADDAPPGEFRHMRDAGMRESLQTGVEKWDDGALRDQWEQIGEGFAYHAREATEDW